MSQTSYGNMATGTAGLIDGGYKDAISLANAEASAAIPFGRMVQFASGGAKVLTAATNQLAGIAFFESDFDRLNGLDSSADGVKAAKMMTILRKGRVWVPVEDNVAVGDRPFVRHTADGGDTVIGGFSNAAGTGLADVRNLGVFVSAGTAGGLAQLEIDMVSMAGSSGGEAFKSAEQTGTGSSQNVAHGLGRTPSLVLVYPTDTSPATVGVYTMAEGTHTSTNVVVTVTSGKKFLVVAWP